jgi:hypothetical protein
MKRFFMMLAILSFLSTELFPQVFIKGIFRNSYDYCKKGDTAVFAGALEYGKKKHLHYILQSSHDMIPAENVQLLLNDLDFWYVQQFYYSSYDIISRGWQTDKRQELEQKTLSFLSKLEAENRIFNDEYTEDYLQRLVQKIHDPEIKKARSQFLNVKILNSDRPICYAFDNGTILISTQLIADSENERELFRILTEAVAHVLLNSNINPADAGSTSELRQLGAIYPESTKIRIRLIAEKYLNHYEKNTPSEPYSQQIRFFNSIAGVISYTAWQEFYSQKYKKALLNINKLVYHNIASSVDYLLIAKIYLKLSDTGNANQKAMEYLKKAVEFEDQPLPEIYSQMGIIHLRENQYEQAKKSFIKYHEMMVAAKNEDKQRWALKMINTCDVFAKISERGVVPSDSLDIEKMDIVE